MATRTKDEQLLNRWHDDLQKFRLPLATLQFKLASF